jgi:hypothetical protein
MWTSVPAPAVAASQQVIHRESFIRHTLQNVHAAIQDARRLSRQVSADARSIAFRSGMRMTGEEKTTRFIGYTAANPGAECEQ